MTMDEIVARVGSGEPTSTESVTDSDTTLIPPPKVRGPRRSAAACQRCRRRKQKCNGQTPTCGTCAVAGVPCQPSSRVIVTGSLICHECHSLRQENRRLRQVINKLKGHGTTTSTSSSPGSLDFGQIPSTDDEEEISDTIRAATPPHVDSAQIHSKQPRLQPSQCFLFRPTFRGTASGSPARNSSSWYLWDDLGLPEGGVIAELSRMEIPSTLAGTESYVDAFFRSCWPQYPVIQRSAFMNEQYIPMVRGERVSDLSAFQVYMVLAIGSCERTSSPASSSPQTHSKRHFQWLKGAVDYLPSIFAAQDDSQLALCLLLLCIYGLSEPQIVDLWYAIGLALRTATGADLHRQTDDLAEDPVAVEMSRRLIWSLYAIDSLVSIALGRPLTIAETDILTPMPSSCLFASEAGQSPLNASMQEEISMFLHIIEMRKLKSTIYASLYLTKVPDRSTLSLTRLNLEARLDKWILSCPPCVAPTTPSMFHTYEWQQVAYHQAILMLYRPSRAFPDSGNLRRCADSSVALINCYSALYSWNRVAYTFTTRVALFMASITLLYAIRLDVSLRRELPKDVVEYTIRSGTHLLRKVSAAGQVGERAASIIQNLSELVLNDAGEGLGWTQEPNLSAGDRSGLDAKLVSWFGLPAVASFQSNFIQEPAGFSDFDMFPNGFLEGAACGVDEILATYASTAF